MDSLSVEFLPFEDSSTLAKAKLQHYLNRAPNAPYVCLSNSAISNISNLLPLLSQLRCMLSLDLSANAIVSLPPAQELVACTPQLCSLNLSHNALDVQSIARSLRSLYALRELFINLPNQQVLFWLARSLPQLHLINGVRFISELREGRNVVHHENEVLCPSVFHLRQRVERLRNSFFSCKGFIDEYYRLMAELKSISEQNLETLGKLTMNDFYADERSKDEVHKKMEFDLIGVAHQCLLEEQSVFKEIFRLTTEVTAKPQNNITDCSDSHVVMGVLNRVSSALNRLSNCYGRTESTNAAVVEETSHIRPKILPMWDDRLQWVNKKFEPRNSLLYLLCVAHKIVWDKERLENSLRGCNRIGLYYTTMQQHMCTYFVNLYPNETETQLSARIVDFFRSLQYYADTEKCIEAHVFAQIIDNSIDESYWKTFESLGTSIANAIECVMSSRVGPGLDKKHINSLSTVSSTWLHRSALLGFLTKEDVFRLIDVILPSSQRDTLLHVDLIETAASLLTVDEHSVPCVTISVLIASFLGVFVRHHERSIQPIVRAFQTVVGKSCGVASPTQLREILKCLGLPADSPEFFFSVWRDTEGPNGDARITFSSVVEVTRRLLL